MQQFGCSPETRGVTGWRGTSPPSRTSRICVLAVQLPAGRTGAGRPPCSSSGSASSAAGADGWLEISYQTRSAQRNPRSIPGILHRACSFYLWSEKYRRCSNIISHCVLQQLRGCIPGVHYHACTGGFDVDGRSSEYTVQLSFLLKQRRYSLILTGKRYTHLRSALTWRTRHAAPPAAAAPVRGARP